MCSQELEPQIEQLCGELLSRLEAHMEEVQQVLANVTSDEVTVRYCFMSS